MQTLKFDKTDVMQTLKFALGRVENIVGKAQNATYQHFLLFPQCFQNVFRVVKSELCGKVNLLLNDNYGNSTTTGAQVSG